MPIQSVDYDNIKKVVCLKLKKVNDLLLTETNQTVIDNLNLQKGLLETILNK